MKLIWITNAQYLSDYKINLTFNDGLNGVVDLKNSIKGEVFKPLKNIDYFKQFKKNSWTIEWDCEVDFAPEFLYRLTERTKG
ncbi:MAG: DUF2442 domain-containing protein [Flavobacteriaceae bacterium]|nr:MAG: DUF2442 domain-containing protein [Flavobacteriaceae bacterium]